jgi:uncharacterized protein YjbI with pentapeptide repeats
MRERNPQIPCKPLFSAGFRTNKRKDRKMIHYQIHHTSSTAKRKKVLFTAPILAAENADESLKKRLAVIWAIEHKVRLAYADLSNADLSGLDLSGVDFTNAIFYGADIRGAIFVNAILKDAVLYCLVFSNVNLTNANLSDADMSGADMRGAVFKGAVFKRAYMRHAILDGHDLTAPEFKGAILDEGVKR